MSGLDKVFTAATLLVFMIVLGLKGNVYLSAQRCTNELYACVNNIQVSLDKEIVCRSSQNYFECLNNAAKHCDFNGGTLIDLIDEARQQMSLYCPEPFISISAISALCLILATLSSMLLHVAILNNYLEWKRDLKG